VPASAREHPGQRGAHAVDHAHHVHGELALGGGVVLLEERAD
jgi:hypothetical protein